MKILNKTIPLLLALATLLAVGNAEVDNATAALAQGLCPIMDGNPVDDSLYVDYQGERIYFCCPPCVDVFNHNPEKYLNALPQFTETSTAEQTTCPVMLGNPIDPSLYVDHEGQRIYFCCKMCVKMFTESPKEYMANLPDTPSPEHGAHDEATHDHENDHEPQGFGRFISFIGKFHPVAVHLPIAMVLGAALAELLFMLTWNYLFRNAAIFNLLMAVLGAVASVPLGLTAASGTRYPAEYDLALTLHKWLGIAVLILTTATAALAVRANRKTAGKNDQWPYRLALLVCVGLVGVTGHFGGLLVYGLNHFSW